MRVYVYGDVVIIVSRLENRIVIKTARSAAVLQLESIENVLERAREHLYDKPEALHVLTKMLEEELASST